MDTASATTPIEPDPDRGPDLPPGARILLTRSCRTPQFADAVRRLRAQYPGVHLTALAPARLDAETRAAGADDVVAYGARRFGLLHAGPGLLARLRNRRFDAVAVPQMSDDVAGHANVYRLAAALGAPIVVILPFGCRLRWYRAGDLARFVIWESIQGWLRRWDVPLFLALLAGAAVAGVWHRARARTRRPPDGRQRVLHVITTLGVGGAQVQLAELVDRTPTSAYDVEILVLGRGDGTFSMQRFARTDIPVDYVDPWPALVPSFFHILRRCRHGRYDIVHTWLFYANVVGAAAARLAGVPYIVSGVRNLSVWKREPNAKWWYRIGDTLAARIPDVLTVNATPLVDDHRWWARTRRSILVVPNGLSAPRVIADTAGAHAWLHASLALAPGATVVGTVGRLAPEKDQTVFLRAVAHARARRPDIHAVIVGDGECEADLRALAYELGFTPETLTFMGRRADARRIIAGLDLFVLTSKSEGFPNVLLEAAFLGTPAISTDVAGARDVLADDDALFPVADAAAGQCCILACLADLHTARVRASATRTRAYRRFTAERSAERWLNIYQTGTTGERN